MTTAIPPDRFRWMAKWLMELANYWKGEIPLRLHRRDLDDGGTPDWHPDFALWLNRPNLHDDTWRRNPEHRVRTTRAFRKLREKFPREYEVVYRVVILGYTVESTVEWLNDNAVRGGKPERYSREDCYLYLLVAAEKLWGWW